MVAVVARAGGMWRIRGIKVLMGNPETLCSIEDPLLIGLNPTLDSGLGQPSLARRAVLQRHRGYELEDLSKIRFDHLDWLTSAARIRER